MLNRKAALKFLKRKLREEKITVPKDIPMEQVAEAFCRYLETDVEEWFKDNFRSFFSEMDETWDWVRKQTKRKRRKTDV